MSRN
jgi:hypothetical protein